MCEIGRAERILGRTLRKVVTSSPRCGRGQSCVWYCWYRTQNVLYAADNDRVSYVDIVIASLLEWLAPRTWRDAVPFYGSVRHHPMLAFAALIPVACERAYAPPAIFTLCWHIWVQKTDWLVARTCDGTNLRAKRRQCPTQWAFHSACK